MASDTKIVNAAHLHGFMLLVWFSDASCRHYDTRTFGIDDESVHATVGILDGGVGLYWADESICYVGELTSHGTVIDLPGAIEGDVLGRIASFRNEMGFNLSELSRAAGINRPSLSGMENGTLNPRLDTFIKALAPLGKTIVITDIDDRIKGTIDRMEGCVESI